MTVHVCRPASVTFRLVRWCPTCERRRRMVAEMAVWYGATTTCCSCGDSWGDGERLPRPFARGWRVEAARRAKRRWAAASVRADADAEFRRLLEAEFGDRG